MARKDKSKSQPNAPELQQLYQQPPHNPYYPDLNSQLIQPPPYSELTVPTSRPAAYQQRTSGQMSQTSQIIGNGDYPRQVVIHQQVPHISVPYDSRSERYHRRVRSFNNQTLLVAIVTSVLSYISYNLYKDRPCILTNFTVHKLNKDTEVTFHGLRDAQYAILNLYAFIALICIIKSCTGRSKSYSCYLFLIAMLSFFAALATGYMAYLCYWTTCQAKVSDVAGKVFKTIASSFTDTLPKPESGIFGEVNVFAAAENDPNGMLIFIFNTVSFVFYFAVFLTSTLMC